MKKVISLLLVYAIFRALSSAAAGEDVGTVVAIQGKVAVWPPGKVTSYLLKLGDTVMQGATVEAEPDAMLKVVFDQAVVTVGGGTKMELTKYRYTREKSIIETLITISKGLVHSQVGTQLGPGSSFQMQSWNTIAGVRGTDFAMEVVPEEFSRVYVFEGEVQVQNLAGIIKLLKRDEMAEIRLDRGPIKVSPLPQDIKERTRLRLEEVRRGSLSSKVAQERAKSQTSPLKISNVQQASSPQERVTGAELVNPKNLSIPPAPAEVKPQPASQQEQPSQPAQSQKPGPQGYQPLPFPKR